MEYPEHHEHILAVRADQFEFEEGLQEISLDNTTSIFAQRAWLEKDMAWRQIIPYVLIEDEHGNYLVYERTPKSGEKGLHNKWAIGAGGHVDICDVVLDEGGAPDLEATIYAGTVRELVEELGLKTIGTCYIMSHKIVSFASKTDVVHVGLVMKLSIKQSDLGEVEDKLNIKGFMSANDIKVQGEGKNEVWVNTLLPVLTGEIDVAWEAFRP